MGTLVTIMICEPDKDDNAIRTAIDSAFKRISEIDEAMSTYNIESEVSRVNSMAGIKKVYVSDDTYAVVEKACEIAGKTDGAFDITVGPLVELWKKAAGEAGIGEYPPEKDSIAAALELVGVLDREKFEFDKEDDGKKYIHLKKKGMRIDLGGIAKGYAVDEAIKVLLKQGIENALVEAGGDIRAIGKQGFSKDWPVDVRHYAGFDRYFERLFIKDQSVATSSDYERGYVIGGVQYSHIIDPRTGEALPRLLSATVVAPDCLTADALATAVCVLGSEGWEKIKERFPRCARLLVCYDTDLKRALIPNE
ncbi:MAG: FAD:protein FMN transferase [Planctomycetota bacterium]